MTNHLAATTTIRNKISGKSEALVFVFIRVWSVNVHAPYILFADDLAISLECWMWENSSLEANDLLGASCRKAMTPQECYDFTFFSPKSFICMIGLSGEFIFLESGNYCLMASSCELTRSQDMQCAISNVSRGVVFSGSFYLTKSDTN